MTETLELIKTISIVINYKNHFLLTAKNPFDRLDKGYFLPSTEMVEEKFQEDTIQRHVYNTHNLTLEEVKLLGFYNKENGERVSVLRATCIYLPRINPADVWLELSTIKMLNEMHQLQGRTIKAFELWEERK